MGNLFQWFDDRDARNNPALPPQRQRLVLNPPTDQDQPMRPLDMASLLARNTPPPADDRTILSPPPESVPADAGRPTLSARDAGDMPSYDASYSQPSLQPASASSEDDIPPYFATSSTYFAPTPNAAPYTTPSPLETDRIRLRQLSDKTDPGYIPVKKPTGFKGHLLEGLREAVIGAGHAWDTSQGDPRQRLGSAIGGAFGGGIGGAIDTGHNNERVRLRDIADARQNLAQEEQNQSYTSQEAEKTARTKNYAEDNARDQQKLVLATQTEKNKSAYWKRKADQGDLKLASQQELQELRDKWMTSKDVNDKRRLDLVEKEMTNRNDRLQKTLDSRESIAGDQIVGRKDVANINQAGATTRTRITQAGADKRNDTNNQLRTQIHNDVMKNGRAAVLTRMQDAYIKEYQKAHRNKMPSQQEIQDHLNNNVLPMLEGDTPQP